MDDTAGLFVDAPVEQGHAARPALPTRSGPVTHAEPQLPRTATGKLQRFRRRELARASA